VSGAAWRVRVRRAAWGWLGSGGAGVELREVGGVAAAPGVFAGQGEQA